MKKNKSDLIPLNHKSETTQAVKNHSSVRQTRPSFKWAGLAALLLALTFLPVTLRAQGTLTNGYTHTDSLSAGGPDTWTFHADFGDRIIVRMGDLTNALGFNPTAQLYNPSGVLIAADLNGSLVAKAVEVSASATNTGTFTVVLGDTFNRAGAYIVTLAKSPGAISVAPGDEGGPMVNGYTYIGTMLVGDLDVWTFNASAGDGIVVRMGDLTNSPNFNPTLRLYGPNGVLVAADLNLSGTGKSAEITLSATNSGTFTVVLGDIYGRAAMYDLTLAKQPGAISVAPGDEGGPMANGYTYNGTLLVGDLDLWSFNASIGDAIVVRMGDLTNAISFYPVLRLYGPNGALIAADLNPSGTGKSAEVAASATNAGTFTVVAGDLYGRTGIYNLTLAKSPGGISVAPGDEGGPLTNGFAHLGNITTGDLDVYSFVACDGEGIQLQMTDLVDGNLSPTLRLYGPNGALLNTASSPTTALISRTTPSPGTYTVVVGDAGQAAGPYRLTGLGISTGFILCKPLITGPNVIVRSAGGPAGSNYVLFTSTNIALPLTNWTPIRTNQLGAYGEFSVTNTFNPAATAQHYFRARTP